MSFRCRYCNEPQPARTKPVKVVTKTRDKLYDNGGRGWEIEEEVNLCEHCSKKERS